MCADLLGKAGINELKLVWDKSREGDEENDESVLEGLQPHSNLKMLEICGFKGKRLPLWEGLNNVMEIRLTYCSECEELPMLGHLPHLKSLYLHGLTNVKSIRSSFVGNIDNRRRDTIVVVFPMLERLELCDMPNLKEWDDGVVFPRLKYLKIYKCVQLTRAPSHFPCLEELWISFMKSSLALENICGIKLTSLTRLIINDIKGLECIPDWLFSNNHNLRELKIDYCPSLRKLPNDLHILNSLESLSITGCHGLKLIPYPNRSGEGQQQHGFTSLRVLKLFGCYGLTHLPIEMVCAPSLETLELKLLSSITNMGMVIGCLHKMTRLRTLEIVEVPKFSVTLNGSLSLQHLEIGPFFSKTLIDSLSCLSSWNNVSYNESVGAILLQCTSLRSLELRGMEHWDCLPDQLQHLTSLKVLHLYNFGIEALPEWFGNLESLEELKLYDCEKLRHLPSQQAMQRLSKLTNLHIRCPLLLKEENRSNNNEGPQIVDSEWPKISHIPRVEVKRQC